MSYLNIWVHLIWSTKYRAAILESDKRIVLFEHIRENAKAKNIYLDCINGYTDHVHCLLRLDPDQTISKTAMLLKGESAFWANGKRLLKIPLQWAPEYYAISVDAFRLNPVRNYIHNQEEHHRKKTFGEECDAFFKENELP